MKIKQVSLDIVCGVTSKLPETGQPEIAFAGKSNVGKSSLINALMNRKALARTSSKPGKTQTINFYHINNEMYLVDLPGYGYASASESERRPWGSRVERYLDSSRDLKAVFLLMDIRHEPSANDKMMYRWILEKGYRPIVIATKKDKIKRSQLQKQVKILRTALEMDKEAVLLPFSALSKEGREEIWQAMEKYIRPAGAEEEENGGQDDR